MRRLICCFVIIMLLAVVSLPVSAEGNTYRISELDMTIEIPSSYDVFTLDMDENDPLFAEYGYSKAEVEEQFVAKNIYLNAVLGDGTEEIVITGSENVISDFAGMGDNALLTLASGLVEEFQEYGITITEYDIYHHPELTFIRLHFHDEKNTVHGLQYYTIFNNTAMNVTLRSYEGIIRVTEEKKMQTIVDSIVLHSYDAVFPDVESTDAFLFTDPDTGVQFRVPENWEEAPLSEGREFLDAQFCSIHDSGLMIAYGSMDLWEMLLPAEKAGISRSDFSTENMSESTAAALLGATSVKKISYHDIVYYMAEATTETEMYGLSFSGTFTCLIRVENGWMYVFLFSGTEDNPHYADFEQLVNSVQYPGEMSEEPDYLMSWVLGATTAGVLVTVLLLVFLLRNRKKKNQVPVPAVPAKQPILFCRECGKRLDANSRFCSECGTQVVEVRREVEP